MQHLLTGVRWAIATTIAAALTAACGTVADSTAPGPQGTSVTPACAVTFDPTDCGVAGNPATRFERSA